MGDVVLGELLRERGLVPSTEPSGSTSSSRRSAEDDVPHVLGARAPSCATPGSGWSTRSARQALGKQLKLADARRARFAVVIGPDDRARGEVMVKDLRARRRCPRRADAVDHAKCARTRHRG